MKAEFDITPLINLVDDGKNVMYFLPVYLKIHNLSEKFLYKVLFENYN